MRPDFSIPDVGVRWQSASRMKWVILAFHGLFASSWFLYDLNLLGSLLAWFFIQFGVHAGYHRYFCHGSFKTYPWMEFVLACMGCLAFQNGPLWWASKHRAHHRLADTEDDAHSPKHGFWHAHIGWLWQEGMERIDWRLVPDLCRPIPVWVEKNQVFIHLFYVSCLVLSFGWASVLTLWIVPIVLCWHTTFATNSVCHLLGTQPFETRPHGYCSARNNIVVAMLNLGEGWHNNHHAFPACSHHGFHQPYQLDIVYLVLFVLEKFNVLWDLKRRVKNRNDRKPPNKSVVRCVSVEGRKE